MSLLTTISRSKVFVQNETMPDISKTFKMLYIVQKLLDIVDDNFRALHLNYNSDLQIAC